jgi:hypothetical protein
MSRLFDPQRPKRGKSAADSLSGGQIPALVRIEHKGAFVADTLAQHRCSSQVAVLVIRANLQLERSKALSFGAVGEFPHFAVVIG